MANIKLAPSSQTSNSPRHRKHQPVRLCLTPPPLHLVIHQRAVAPRLPPALVFDSKELTAAAPWLPPASTRAHERAVRSRFLSCAPARRTEGLDPHPKQEALSWMGEAHRGRLGPRAAKPSRPARAPALLGGHSFEHARGTVRAGPAPGPRAPLLSTLERSPIVPRHRNQAALLFTLERSPISPCSSPQRLNSWRHLEGGPVGDGALDEAGEGLAGAAGHAQLVVVEQLVRPPLAAHLHNVLKHLARRRLAVRLRPEPAPMEYQGAEFKCCKKSISNANCSPWPRTCAAANASEPPTPADE